MSHEHGRAMLASLLLAATLAGGCAADPTGPSEATAAAGRDEPVATAPAQAPRLTEPAALALRQGVDDVVTRVLAALAESARAPLERALADAHEAIADRDAARIDAARAGLIDALAAFDDADRAGTEADLTVIGLLAERMAEVLASSAAGAGQTDGKEIVR